MQYSINEPVHEQRICISASAPHITRKQDRYGFFPTFDSI